MRVLIVAANQEHKPDPVVPLGAACVAGAAMHAGHDVRLFDACFMGEEWPGRLADTVQCFPPDVVGLSLRNIDDVAWPRAHSYLPHYREVVRAIRRLAPKAALVLGGSAFTLMPRQFMAALQPDCGVAGEGETAFVEMLAELQLEGALALEGRVVTGRPSAAVRPATELVDLAAYYRHGGALNVQSRRGCPFQCAYCTYPLLEGRQARVHPVGECVDQIARAVRDHDARHFFVVDNTFNQPHEHALAFCAELERRRLDVRWTAYLSPQGTTRELMRAMAGAGCSSVEFGTDAAAAATLAGLGKSFGVDEILQASRYAGDAGVRFAHSLILGGPGETPQTLRETVRVVEGTGPTAVFAMLGVRLYPGTPLARKVELEGVMREADIGLEPVFYISEGVQDRLEAMALEIRGTHRHWYFPGLEGDRWLKFWRRRRAHGLRGPLWEWMGQPEVSHGSNN